MTIEKGTGRVTNEELAEVVRLSAVARNMDGETGPRVIARGRLVQLAGPMAADLLALRVAVREVARMWVTDDVGGEPMANLIALDGDAPADLVLVPAEELARLRGLDVANREAHQAIAKLKADLALLEAQRLPEAEAVLSRFVEQVRPGPMPSPFGVDVEVRMFRVRGTRVHASGPGIHGIDPDNWSIYSPVSDDGQSVRVEQAPDLHTALALARSRGAEDAPRYAEYMGAWQQPVEPFVAPPAVPS